MKQVMVLARASILEHSRRKLIIFFVIVSLAVAAWQIYLAVEGVQIPGAPGQSSPSPVSVGFYDALALLAALAVSMGNIGRPFSDGEALLVLSRPLARWQYAAGRLAASVGLIAALCLLMAAEMQVVRIVGGSSMSPVLWGHWAIHAYNLAIVAVIATLVSSFTASPVIAAVVAFLIDRFVATVGVVYRLVELGQVEGTVSSLVRAAWYVTPKKLTSPLLLSQFDRLGSQLRERIPLVENSPLLVLWSVAYLVLLLTVISFVVNRKEVNG